jgi:hypothetical protein
VDNSKENKKCPICKLPVVAPNRFVRFHIRYKPPLIIMACQYCNDTEHAIRWSKGARAPLVIAYFESIGIEL